MITSSKDRAVTGAEGREYFLLQGVRALTTLIEITILAAGKRIRASLACTVMINFINNNNDICIGPNPLIVQCALH